MSSVRARIGSIVFGGVISIGATAEATVTATPFGSAAFRGNPTWQPVDFNFFSGQIGDPSNGFADFALTNQMLFPAPGYGYDPAHNGVIPGTQPVPGPYNTKVSQALAANGITPQSTFQIPQFQIPFAAYLDWVMIPTAAAPIGSSADFASGRIVPNSILPMTFAGQTLRNGALFDPFWSGQWDPTTVLTNPIAVDGWSHMPAITAETFEFDAGSPPAPTAFGSYVHQFTLTDNQGNGWSIDAPFEVVPEPGTLTGVAAAAVMALIRRRRD